MSAARVLPLLIIAVLLPGRAPLLGQGSLTPPVGPLAPSMKTLDQVEPRKPVDQTNTPGDAQYEAIISSPGSYYLTGNLGVAKPNGIHIDSVGVTLDLNGFRISRSSGSGGLGIRISPTSNDCLVTNGSLSGFNNGVSCVPASGDVLATGGAFTRLIVSNGGSGLAGGKTWRIEQCAAHDLTSFAFSTSNNSKIIDCAAYNNEGSFDLIYTGRGSLLRGVTASGNRFYYIAIRGGVGSTIENCVASDNPFGTPGVGIYGISAVTIRGCTVAGNTIGGSGIFAGAGSTVVDSTVAENTGSTVNPAHGIFVGAGSVVSNCTVRLNTGQYSSSAGITTQSGCLILGSTVAENTNTNGTVSADTGIGINAADHCTIVNSLVRANKGDGIRGGETTTVQGCMVEGNGVGTGTGIKVGAGSTVAHTSVRNSKLDGINVGTGSKVTHCTVTKNGNDGIDLAEGAEASDCTVHENSGDGIVARNRNLVRNCHSFKNSASGIWSPGGRSRIEGNNLVENTNQGISASSGTSLGNLIIRNTASANSGGNYVIGGSNVNAQVLSPGSGFTSTDPNANISY